MYIEYMVLVSAGLMRVSVHKQKAQFVDVVAQVGYVAAKQGVHTLPDGRVFEAGEVDTMARPLDCTRTCRAMPC